MQYLTITLEQFSAQASCVAILGLIKIKSHRLPATTGPQNRARNSPSYSSLMQLTDLMGFNPFSKVMTLAVASVRPPLAPADSSRVTLGTCECSWPCAALHVCAQKLPRRRSGRNPMQCNPTDTRINDMTGRSLLHLKPLALEANGET